MRNVNILLLSCAWALYSSISIVIGKTPGKLVYYKDIIMQVEIDINWSDVLRKKEKTIAKNNKLESAKRINYDYEVRDYVKIIHEKNIHMRPIKLSSPQVNDHTK